MKETVFIQFYGKTHSGWFDLCNGFSDTWQTCRSLGDFLWFPHLQDTTLWYTPEAYQDVDLPFSEGLAYVSASYINHLYQAYTWAVKYPWDPLYCRRACGSGTSSPKGAVASGPFQGGRKTAG